VIGDGRCRLSPREGDGRVTRPQSTAVLARRVTRESAHRLSGSALEQNFVRYDDRHVQRARPATRRTARSRAVLSVVVTQKSLRLYAMSSRLTLPPNDGFASTTEAGRSVLSREGRRHRSRAIRPLPTPFGNRVEVDFCAPLMFSRMFTRTSTGQAVDCIGPAKLWNIGFHWNSVRVLVEQTPA
jgi:hypothetical protein